MKHFCAAPQIEIPYLISAMTERDERRDNRSRAGACDIIEIVGENELWIPATLTQLRFYPCENFDTDNSPNPSTIACEQFSRTGFI